MFVHTYQFITELCLYVFSENILLMFVDTKKDVFQLLVQISVYLQSFLLLLTLNNMQYSLSVPSLVRLATDTACSDEDDTLQLRVKTHI